ncbi:YciI family protein [Dactylosporangium sp. NPDC049742]|uniref:YciI family protein n=1 Tax=Dactylosporangium sp. NPDC049742 TaxID=3154737 RepID=UPI003427324D
MPHYLVSFDEGWMNVAEEDVPDVTKAAQEVAQDARDAGVWVFGGGVPAQPATVVAADGSVTDGPFPETKEHIGGFALLDVPDRDEAVRWAARFAAACRCTQEVRELAADAAD